MASLHAAKGADPFQDPDFQADRGQNPLDDRAVLRREPPCREEAPAGEGEHDPREQGEGQEELVTQAERWHGAKFSGTGPRKRGARNLPMRNVEK
jgi:hypothetical protein